MRILFAAATVLVASAGLAACTGVPAGVEPVQGFDVQRYAGTWYSIHRLDHRFERNLTNVSARYAVRPDGTVEVVNRGFDRLECAWEEVVGTAKFRGSPEVASLAVTFQWPFAGGYHVFALDPDYRWVMVAGPSHEYLWILSREPRLAPEVRDRLVAKARAAGFPVDELQTVDHGAPTCADGRAAPAGA